VTAQLRHRNYDRTDSVIGWMWKLPYVRHEPTSIVFVGKVVQRYCQFQNKVAGTRSPEWGYPSHHGFTTETVSWLGWFGASLSKETLIPAGFISYSVLWEQCLSGCVKHVKICSGDSDVSLIFDVSWTYSQMIAVSCISAKIHLRARHCNQGKHVADICFYNWMSLILGHAAIHFCYTAYNQ
jgi:hypothetical protein